MKSIPKPKIKVKEVFLECISTVDDQTLKNELTNCVDILVAGEIDFENKFTTHELHQIAQNPIVKDSIKKEQMKVIYDYRMVRLGMPGNKYYNKIKSAAPYGKCPLCSIRWVDTLDHYLPKSKYPIYAVTPINLIPACFNCNKGKGIDYPTSSEEQTLHPYFDEVENESWLKANVIQASPISFDYFVNPPVGWSQIKKNRVKNHFSSFHLNELFVSHANEELRGIKNYLVNLYSNHPDLMIEHLAEAYSSRLELGVNSWQAVMYHSLLNDVWFCSGGVLV